VNDYESEMKRIMEALGLQYQPPPPPAFPTPAVPEVQGPPLEGGMSQMPPAGMSVPQDFVVPQPTLDRVVGVPPVQGPPLPPPPPPPPPQMKRSPADVARVRDAIKAILEGNRFIPGPKP
jgi:hypothetical protein